MTNTTKQTEAISTERALKLALEALESCDAAHITDGGRQWYDEKLVDKAVEAIEKALASEAKEQPAQQKLVPYEPSIDMQEQGSIASGYDLSQARAKKVYQAMIDMHDVMMEREPTDEWFRLQAGYPKQPAQRKPLTDDELLEVIKKIDRDEQFIQSSLRQLARAIEAAHGIKGDA